jgi:GNAT superfamily N-acetyltransferase
VSPLEIVSCTPELRGQFAQIWVPWLRGMTGREPEPEDLLAVADPESFYVHGGGAVLFALKDGGPIGVVAIKHLGGGAYEFCKLVVLEEARGLGAGRALVAACISFVRRAGGQLLMLQSFRRLEVALAMYERMGFKPMAAPEGMLVLARTEVIMGLRLEGRATA